MNDKRQNQTAHYLLIPAEPTEAMLEAARAVPWVRSFQGEFEGFEPEHDVIMRERVRELWHALLGAIQANKSNHVETARAKWGCDQMDAELEEHLKND